MLKNKKYVVFFSILIFFLFLNSQLFSLITKDQNLILANQLIKGKKFNKALEILVTELENNEADEDAIMKLIDQINKEKVKIMSLINLAKESIKNGDYNKAEEVITILEASGDFDQNINDLINKLSKEKLVLKDITLFNNMVIGDGEKFYFSYDIKNAMLIYKQALDIYRNKDEVINDNDFKKTIDLFNDAEKKIFEEDIKDKIIELNEDLSYNFILQQKDLMENQLLKWKTLENDFMKIGYAFSNLKIETKKTLLFEAYNSITDKYTGITRRYIQKYANELQSYVIQFLENNLDLYEKGELNERNEIDNSISLLNDLEKNSFYKISFDLTKDYLITRSKNNIVEYLNYLTKKNTLILKSYEIDLNKSYQLADDLDQSFDDKKKNKELLEAETDIINASNELKTTENKKKDFSDKLSSYRGLNYGSFNDPFKSEKEMNDKLPPFEKKVDSTLADFETVMTNLKELINEGDKLFQDSVKDYNTKIFTKAKDGFDSSKDKYLEVVLSLKSGYVNDQIDKIDQYLDNINQLIFTQEMKNADDYIEKAKVNLYAEKYDDAKNNIDEAEKIYVKYNQNEDIINFYRDRILHALKIQSGKILSIDDPAYEAITELFRNAKSNYEQKKYNEALSYINQILLEKPYYEDAKLFEIKILLETNPKGFDEVYLNYFNKAKASFDTKSFEDALVQFQELLQFNRNTREINNYIYQCKLFLNLTKKIITDNDRKSALSIIKDAQDNYSRGEFQAAYNKVNQAIEIWEDVPEAKSIKLACMQKLKIERPKLNRDNELLYIEALKAYSENDFEKAYQLTNDILKSQDFEEVRLLNKKAEVRRKI